MWGRGVFAALVAFAALGSGIFVFARLAGRPAADFLALLLMKLGGAGLACVIVGWIAAIFGLISLIAVFAAFAEDEERSALRRRSPKGFAAGLVVFALALIWLAFACLGRLPGAIEAPVAVAIAPIDQAGPGETPVPETPALAPEIEVETVETDLVWPYKYPLMRTDGYVRSPEAIARLDALFAGDAGADPRRLLCGKAWVAFTGAASEEGPPARNRARARARAEIAVSRAREWLAGQPASCERPILLAIDLGQHSPTGAIGNEGEATAHQRRLLVVSRLRRNKDDWPDTEAAKRELTDFLADPAGRARLLGARRYAADPLAYAP